MHLHVYSTPLIPAEVRRHLLAREFALKLFPPEGEREGKTRERAGKETFHFFQLPFLLRVYFLSFFPARPSSFFRSYSLADESLPTKVRAPAKERTRKKDNEPRADRGLIRRERESRPRALSLSYLYPTTGTMNTTSLGKFR